MTKKVSNIIFIYLIVVRNIIRYNFLSKIIEKIFVIINTHSSRYIIWICSVGNIANAIAATRLDYVLRDWPVSFINSSSSTSKIKIFAKENIP